MGRVGGAKPPQPGARERAGGFMEAQPLLSLDVDRRGSAVLVSPHGRITELVSHELERQLLGLIEGGSVRIVMDLYDVPFISSAGLGALMLAHKEARKNDGRVCLARPQPLVRQILETTKLTKLFGLYTSVEDALTAD